jgi:hypothetical protein
MGGVYASSAAQLSFANIALALQLRVIFQKSIAQGILGPVASSSSLQAILAVSPGLSLLRNVSS